MWFQILITLLHSLIIYNFIVGKIPVKPGMTPATLTVLNGGQIHWELEGSAAE